MLCQKQHAEIDSGASKIMMMKVKNWRHYSMKFFSPTQAESAEAESLTVFKRLKCRRRMIENQRNL